jgi:hypothetical protein
MQAHYGDNCLWRSKIYEWIDLFKKGRTSVCDEDRSGRPSTSRTENSIQAVERMVREKQTNHSGSFHMFGPMKEALRGRRFSSDEEVIGATQNCLKTRPKNFFSDGIKKRKKKLVKHCTGALKSRGITLKSDISFVSVYLK